jgi:uncharacterized protein YebE (UPF0316 family)
MPAFFDSATYTWILLPILIFCARILDVSLDTVRIIFINNNRRWYVAFIAFFAVLIWPIPPKPMARVRSAIW